MTAFFVLQLSWIPSQGKWVRLSTRGNEMLIHHHIFSEQKTPLSFCSKWWNNQPHPITLKLYISIVIKADFRKRGRAMKLFLSYTSSCLSADVAEAHEEAGCSRAHVLHFSCLQDQWETRNPFHHWTLHQLRHCNEPEFRRASRALDPTWSGLAVSA